MRTKVLFILSIFFFLSLIVTLWILKNQTEKLNSEISQNSILIKNKNDTIIYLRKKNEEFKNFKSNFFDKYDSTQFVKKYGIKNPVEFITNDLESRLDLIPYEGSRGSKMFYGSIVILNHSWVYAYFEDGHYGGYLILKYKIQENNTISWKVIAVSPLDLEDN